MFRSAVLLALLGLAACNGAPSDSADAETTASSTYALVAVQRSSSATQPSRTELVARFVRSRGEASSTFAALGSNLNMPQLGTCSKVSTLLTPASDDLTGPIELLDVGRVEVGSIGVTRAALEPRELPNLGDFARGTFYSLSGSRAATGTVVDVAPGIRYDVSVGGSNEFAPLSVSAMAPFEPSDIAIDGAPATSSITLTKNQTFRLTWAKDDAGDIVYVDSSDANSHETTRCAFADTGFADVPQPAGTTGNLEVHRLRRHAATATAELRFDFYRSFTFQRD